MVRFKTMVKRWKRIIKMNKEGQRWKLILAYYMAFFFSIVVVIPLELVGVKYSYYIIPLIMPFYAWVIMTNTIYDWFKEKRK